MAKAKRKKAAGKKGYKVCPVVNKTHEQLYDRAKEAINELFNDISVERDKTIDSLALLSEDIDAMVELLKEKIIE